MKVNHYKMSQPYKVIVEVEPERVVKDIMGFWKEHGARLMKETPGSWTKIDMVKSYWESKEGNKLYYDIVWDWAEEGLKQSGLKTESVNSISIDKLSEREGAILAVVVEVTPKVKLGDYRNIQLLAPSFETTDKEIEGQIILALSRSPLVVEKEEPGKIEMGDSVKMFFKVLDPSNREEPIEEREDVMLMSDTIPYVPGFVEAIVGAEAPTNISKELDVPENHPLYAKTKKVILEAELKAIVKRDLPTEEQEAARLEKTVEEWKESMRQEMTDGKKQSFEARKKDFIRTNVEKELISMSEFEPIPDAMIEREAENVLRTFAAAKNLTVDDYLKETKLDKDTVMKQLMPLAINRTMVRIIVDAIFEAEKMEVTDEERDKYIEKYAKERREEVEEVKKKIEGVDISFLVRTYMVDEFLCNNTTINYQ